ncbi:MAG: aldehyde dehydrogenase EutE [Chloroflexi bacterium]|nr:aldehyde dehydrogenase EutE [Chloroflexota bacterium]
MDVEERRIQAIVQEVMRRLGEERPVAEAPPRPELRSAPAQPEPLHGEDGVFPDIDSAIMAASTAFHQLDRMTLTTRYHIVDAMRRAAKDNAELLARLAWQETGMGRPEDKTKKNLLVATKTPGPEILEPFAWTGDHGLTLVERAPYGVIAAITPSTNPTSTIICNAIGMISAGNAVVFNAHPAAKNCSVKTVQLLNRAIVSAGGPPNLLTLVPEPTIEGAQYLMKHPAINLLVVTGGPGVVKVAMASGKKAICAGPGNPPVVVDETADLDVAGKGIVEGASFDNNVVCVLEKEIIAVDSIADQLKASILSHGAVELASWQMKRLEKVIFSEIRSGREESVINKAWVGKNASLILKEIGMNVDEKVRLALAEVDRDHPLVWTEQLMPVIPLVRVANADEAIDLAIAAEGRRYHTAVMYSKHIDRLSRMARECNCSIFVKNGPSLAGLGFNGEGFTSFSIASPTGEGLTSPISFSRLRRCVLVDSFRIV